MLLEYLSHMSFPIKTYPSYQGIHGFDAAAFPETSVRGCPPARDCRRNQTAEEPLRPLCRNELA